MARIRTIKPDFFRHGGLYDAERETGMPLRVAFAGMWTAADREGRFRWKPRELKLDCLPHDEVDFSRVLDALLTRGFIVKYAVEGDEYGHIPSWHEHQIINNREKPSSLPEPNENNTLTREPRVNHACPTRLNSPQGEGKGREGEREGERDVVVEARASELEPLAEDRPPARPVVSVPAEKRAAIALGLAFVQAAGFKDYAEAPMNWYGVADRAAGWIVRGWSQAMIVAETKIVTERSGTTMPLAYYEKVFATAAARAAQPLPIATIREAENVDAVRTNSRAGQPNRSVGDALEALTRRLEQNDGEAGDRGGDRLVTLLAKG
jgi:hypothetical protein